MRKRHHDEAPVLPEAGAELPSIELRTRHGSNHPWVFRRMIDEERPELDPGTLVEVTDNTGQFVGRGFYNPNSEISVRLLTLTPDAFPDRRYFIGAITRAAKLRQDVLGLPKICDAY